MSETKKKPGPRLHPAAVLAVVAGFGSAALLVALGTPGESRDWMVVSATALMLLLVTLVVAQVVFLISKRSSRAFNVVMALVFVSFTVFNTWATLRGREAKSRAMATAQSPASTQHSTRESLPVSPSPASTTSGSDARPALTRKQNGEAIEQVAVPLSNQILARAAAFSKINQEFADAGSIVPSTLTSAEEVANRAAILGRMRSANVEFREVLTEALGRLRKQLTERGMRPAVVDAAAEAFSERMQLPKYTQLTEVRGELLEAMVRYFDLVSKNWGTQRVENQRFVYEDAAINSAMMQAMSAIVSASEKEDATIAEYAPKGPVNDAAADDGPATDAPPSDE